jgi:hypothetical protein
MAEIKGGNYYIGPKYNRLIQVHNHYRANMSALHLYIVVINLIIENSNNINWFQTSTCTCMLIMMYM